MSMRVKYIIILAVIIAAEVMIALFVHDGFVRPYLGDVIVVWAVYCLIQAVTGGRGNHYITAAGVMLFAFAVEFLQKIHIADILHLGGIKFFRVLIGTNYSPADLICYAAGTLVMAAGIAVYRRKTADRQ